LTFGNGAQAEDLAEFPVLVRLNSSRIDYGRVQNGGEDLRFIDADGSELSYEIERWDEGGESVVWVKVPQIDGLSNSDYIWMYYGNDSISDGQDVHGVWDTNFLMVWHLNDQPTGTPGDIPNSANNLLLPDDGLGQSYNMDGTNRINGSIGYGISFNGADEWLEPNSPAGGVFHDVISELTFEALVKTNNTATTQTIYEEGGSTNGYYVGIAGNTVRVVTRDSSTQREVSKSLTDTGSFHYVAGIFSNGTLLLYLDGGMPSSFSAGYPSIGTHTGEPGVGRSPDTDATGVGGDKYLNGFIDEVRISANVRSSDWIAAQYASMSDNFISFGEEQDF